MQCVKAPVSPHPHECLILSHFNTFCQPNRWKKHISPLFQFAFPWSQVRLSLFIFLLAIHSFSSMNYLFVFLSIFLLNCLYYWFLGVIWIAKTLASCHVMYIIFFPGLFCTCKLCSFCVLSCRSFKFRSSQIINYFFSKNLLCPRLFSLRDILYSPIISLIVIMDFIFLFRSLICLSNFHMPFTKWFHVAILSLLLYIACIFLYTVVRLLIRYAQIIPVNQVTFKMYKECRWFISVRWRYFIKNTPTSNFVCINLHLHELCLISFLLGMAASLTAFNEYLQSWHECALFQAVFKSLTLFCFSFSAFFYLVHMSNFKKEKIGKHVLQGDKTQGLPFLEGKS